jgi:glycosyltransferase involved in cell wall biosynthesis
VRLSIVVPAFNEERLIASTLQAIRAAARCFDARGGWELIVCDNNSTDRTAEIACAAAATVVFEPHNQISRARNRGAAVASGEWLLFVDADSAPSAELFLDLQRTLDGGDCLAGGSTIAAVGPLKFRAGIRAWNALSRAMSWAAGSFIFCEELYAAEELELFGRLKRLARARGERIVILRRHPLRTSARKLEFYGRGELLALLARIVLHPHKTLRSREACGPWYDGRR